MVKPEDFSPAIAGKIAELRVAFQKTKDGAELCRLASIDKEKTTHEELIMILKLQQSKDYIDFKNAITSIGIENQEKPKIK